jgi:AcrR family transcriptional regulator
MNAVTSGGSARNAEYLANHLKARLIESGRELFCTQGYLATTTKEICEHAGVSEPSLYRYFGSKADLFEKIIADPLTEWTGSMSTYWERQPFADVLVRYLTELYDVIEGNRDLLRPLLAASLDPGNGLEEVAKRVSADFTAGLTSIIKSARALTEERDMPSSDFEAAVGAEISMVLGTVLLADWVFPANSRPGRSRMIKEMTRIFLGGFTQGQVPKHEPDSAPGLSEC